MVDAYTAYASKARTIASRHPVPLVGVTKTRRQAMVRYSEIVAEIRACEDEDTLTVYLATIRSDIKQFRAELDYLWKGDGEDFLGLSGEIEQQRQSFQSDLGSETERLFGQF